MTRTQYSVARLIHSASQEIQRGNWLEAGRKVGAMECIIGTSYREAVFLRKRAVEETPSATEYARFVLGRSKEYAKRGVDFYPLIE